MDDLRRIVGARVRAIREYRGLRQPDVGKKVGHLTASVSLFERGQAAVTVEQLIAYASALNVRAETIIQGLTQVEGVPMSRKLAARLFSEIEIPAPAADPTEAETPPSVDTEHGCR